MTNHIYIHGQIGVSAFEQGITLTDVQNQYNRDAVEVVVHINSPGGDVVEGFAIHDFLKNVPQKVTTIVEGKCYSIATVILLSGDMRMMNKNAELMIHNPWGGIEGEADEIERYAQNVRKAEERLASFYAETLSRNIDEVKQLMQQTTFMDLNESLNMGFIMRPVEPFHAVAFFKPSNIKSMNISAEDKTWLQKSFDRLAGMFEKNGIKAEEQAAEPTQSMVDIVLVSGDGEEKTAYVDSTDGELEGKSIYMNSEMTEPAPDGVHMLRDGRTIDVEDGRIVTVREAEGMKEDEEEMTALKAELESARAELEQMRAAVQESQQIAASAQEVADQRNADMQTILAEMQEIKQRVIGASTPPAKAPVKATENKTSGDPVEAAFQKWAEQIGY